jgi:hypothetical protein
MGNDGEGGQKFTRMLHEHYRLHANVKHPLFGATSIYKRQDIE